MNPDSPQFAEAMAHYAAGRWADAARCAESLLSADPNDARALHLSGAAAAQAGRIDEAVDRLRRAAQADPNLADAWLDLARLFDALKRPDEALEALTNFARVRPEKSLLVHIADQLHKRARYADSAEHFRRAIALSPGEADLHARLAGALLEANDPSAAEPAAREALHLDPDFAVAWFNLGSALEHQGRLDDAVDAYRRVIALEPRFSRAHCNLGVVLQKQNRLAESIDAFRRAVELDPRFALASSDLGHVLALAGRVEEAEAVSRKAVALEPDNSIFLSNLATILGRGHRYDEALALLERAIQLDPKNHLAHAQMGLILLQLGHMREGWREFEWRAREWAPVTGRRTWDGSPLNGAPLVLRAEQGFGDTIQFVRYAPLVRSRGGAGKVIVECPPDLKELMLTAAGVDEVYAWGDPAPAAELEVWMMSLPARFDALPDTIPRDVPYVRHDPARARRMRPMVDPAAASLKVGLVWAGNPDHPGDQERSCSFETIAPLARIEGVTCFSLQRGPQQSRDAARVAQAGMINLANECHNIADLAAAMSLLDLIVTVDTSACHLAGALALPVWTMLAHRPDWRWALGQSDTPWYPTMRLFRQASPRDWPGVIEQVMRALRAKMERGTSP